MKFYYSLFALVSLLVLSPTYALNNTMCSPTEKAGIDIAIKGYLNKTQTMKFDNILVLSKKCSDGFARARLHPKTPVTDDATAFLRKVNGKWQVLAIGTGFDPRFLNKIPQELRQ